MRQWVVDGLLFGGRNGETRFSMGEFALISGNDDVNKEMCRFCDGFGLYMFEKRLIIKKRREREKRRIIFISRFFDKFFKFSESSVSYIKNRYVQKSHSIPLFIYALFIKWIGSFWNKEKQKSRILRNKKINRDQHASGHEIFHFYLNNNYCDDSFKHKYTIIYHFSRSIRNVISMMAISDGIYIVSF